MLNPDSYITKDGNVFFFELEEYNSKSDIPMEEGDLIRFTNEGKKYCGTITVMGSKKNLSFVLENIKKL